MTGPRSAPPGQLPSAPATGGGVEWTDELWDRVWERNLGPVERHDIAVATWRRRPPDDHFERLVAGELARRWRARAIGLALLYALWTAFWAALAYRDWRLDAALQSGLAPGAALLGCLAVALCALVWLRLRDDDHRSGGTR